MGMIHVQKFVASDIRRHVAGNGGIIAGLDGRPRTASVSEREECNFSPIDESPLQNDSTSGSLLSFVVAVPFCCYSM